MAIDFTKLPSDKPQSNTAKGSYVAVIESAEMKAPKDTSKPKYLSMRLALFTPDGKAAGKVYDMLNESEHEIPRFKLRRFIEAIGFVPTAVFDLKDLIKICVNKKIIVDICPEKKDGVLTGYSTVDVSSGDIYYNMSEVSRKFEGAVAAAPSLVVAAPDAEDGDPY